MVARPLTVIQMVPGLDSGGVERGTLEIGAYLASRGHRSIVVSSGGRLVPELVVGGSRHVRMPVEDHGPRALRAFSPLRDLVLTEKPDILHLRSRMPAWVAMAVLGSLPAPTRPRVVTTFHGLYSPHPGSAVMARGERVIAISRFIYRHVRERYRVPPERLVIIPRGYDPEKFDPAAVEHSRVEALQRKWGVDPEAGPVLIMCGRITPIKGWEVFLDALSLIREFPYTAVCVGDKRDNPDYAARLQARVEELGLSGRVVFPGHCPDMPAAFAAADIAVSASVHPEAFGRVAVEAQAMGLPVAATAHGGSLETVVHGHTGWLVPPGNAPALAAALARGVARPGERRQLGENARARVGRFTTENMCEKTLAVYEELVLGKGCAGR
ncbi:MAG: glycosyltransferase family 4 protein [Deltaproteobacteria bacterium]|nr:glycosyltransferase family 4 protein [Deltaproteobacteria bacterium]